MLEQHTLSPHPLSRKKKKRRLGRGDASGHGSFSTRGCKGQNARSGGGVRPGFEGGQTPLSRRLPKKKGFKNPCKIAYQVVNVQKLNMFEDDSTVDAEVLFKKNLISKKTLPIKILGDGDLKRKLTVKVDAVSKSAKEKIDAAKGCVLLRF